MTEQEKGESIDKTFVFKIKSGDENVRIDFDPVDAEGNVTSEEVSVVDLSMIVITLTKLLKDQGLSEEELKEFMVNVVTEASNSDIVGNQDGE